MRRTNALALLLSLVALLGLLAGCGDDGDDDAAPATTLAPTTTTEELEVFDPDAGDSDDDDSGDPSDDDGDTGGCSVDPEESNEATIIGDWVDCVQPDLADVVTGANFQGSGGDAEAYVSGDLDVEDALRVCDVVADLFDGVLTEYDVTITVTTDSDVVGETGTPLVTGSTPGTCEPA
jgi:hypothetical protein